MKNRGDTEANHSGQSPSVRNSLTQRTQKVGRDTPKRSSRSNPGLGEYGSGQARVRYAAFVSVMESDHFWKLHNISQFWWLDISWKRRILVEGQMGACSFVEVEIIGEEPLQ